VLALYAMWLSRDWVTRPQPSAAGPVIEATLQFTAADVAAAQAAMAQARAATPPPQPIEEPAPQTADEPLQDQPQAPLERPDEVEQDAVSRLAVEPSEETEEQEERNREEQVELTEDIARQQEAENRQRLREQYEAIKREREQAQQQTRMEEQRLAQLADRNKPAPVDPGPRTGPPTPPAGAAGRDDDLRARYIAALNTTARDNWNTGLAPELVRCRVRFQQIPGGEVINVEFMDCPYDAQGRESVERALRKTPMPYSGFELVFESKVNLTFCHPQEACQ
jgi:colicin import membrane protein